MLQSSRLALAVFFALSVACDPGVVAGGIPIPGQLLGVEGVRFSKETSPPPPQEPQGPPIICCHCSGNGSCGKGGLPPCPPQWPGPQIPPQQPGEQLP